MASVLDFLVLLRRMNVMVWVDGELLFYRAPSALTPTELQCLEEWKPEIIALLSKSPPRAEARLELKPRDVGAEVPLTFQQQWLWHVLLPLYPPERFNISSALRLVGRLDISALQSSVQALASHHESLRTTIIESNGMVLQKIASEFGVPITMLRVRGRVSEEREREARRLIHEFVVEPSNYFSGPLFKVRLLRLSEYDHVLVILLDHMISDGISLGVLLGHLRVAYSLAVRRKKLALADSSLQYADYAVWQKTTEQYWAQMHSAYWDMKLNGAVPICFSRDIDTNVTFPKSAEAQTFLEKDLCAELRKLASMEGTTLPMVLLSAFVVLVSRWCCQHDVVVPFNSMGRHHSAVADAIGYFAHIIHLRIKVSEEDTYLDILDRAKTEYRTACEHDDFGRIVRTKPQFVKSAWFQCEPMFDEVSNVSGFLENIQTESFQKDQSVSSYVNDGFSVDIEFLFIELLGGVFVRIGYRSDRFKQNTIDKMGQFLRSICRDFAIHPTTKPAELLDRRVGEMS